MSQGIRGLGSNLQAYLKGLLELTRLNYKTLQALMLAHRFGLVPWASTRRQQIRYWRRPTGLT